MQNAKQTVSGENNNNECVIFAFGFLQIFGFAVLSVAFELCARIFRAWYTSQTELCPLACKWVNFILIFKLKYYTTLHTLFFLTIRKCVQCTHSWKCTRLKTISKIANMRTRKQQQKKTMGDSPAQPPNKFPFKMCLFYLHGTINQIPFVKLSVWYLKKNNSNNKVYAHTHTHTLNNS